MDVLIQRIDGEITILADDEEVAQFSDCVDPVVMLETTLSGLGYNVDIIEREAEEGEEDSSEDLQDEEIS